MLNLEHISFTGTKPEGSGRSSKPPVPSRGVSFTPVMRNAHALDEEHHPLVTEVLHQAGLPVRYYRVRVLARRLAACQRLAGWRQKINSPAELARRPVLAAAALNTLLIGVSGFFRDTTVFETLERRVVPQLAQGSRPLRIYVPGASAGQEVYSLAMLFAAVGALVRCEFVGVDCRPDAIAWARRGIYSEEALEAVSGERRRRYFEPTGDGWRVDSALRSRTRWQAADVFQFDAGATGLWDLISFRNVAIYLEPEFAERAWRRLCGQLAPGGFLVTGKAEMPAPDLPLRRVAPCVYRKDLFA